jgi:hypothetical protein
MGRAFVVGVVLSLALTLSGVALASPYSTVSRLPGVPPVLSWILHSSSSKSLSSTLAGKLSSEPKSMFWADACDSNPGQSADAKSCAFGDTSAKQTVVIYGDSFALQWVPALNELGVTDHFKVLAFVRIGCPFADKAVLDYQGSIDSGCLTFRSNVVAAINSMRPAPQLVVMAEDVYRTTPSGSSISTKQWASAVQKTLTQLAGRRFPIGVIIGTPAAKLVPNACLAAHSSDVQACNTPINIAFNRSADSRIASAIKSAHSYLVDVSMLLCGNTCPDILHNTLVHSDRWHLSDAYVLSLGRSFGSLVGCIGERAPRSEVPTGGVLTRLLSHTARSYAVACKAAVTAPFNL